MHNNNSLHFFFQVVWTLSFLSFFSLSFICLFLFLFLSLLSFRVFVCAYAHLCGYLCMSVFGHVATLLHRPCSLHNFFVFTCLLPAGSIPCFLSASLSVANFSTLYLLSLFLYSSLPLSLFLLVMLPLSLFPLSHSPCYSLYVFLMRKGLLLIYLGKYTFKAPSVAEPL